jgi:hypothetical protein
MRILQSYIFFEKVGYKIRNELLFSTIRKNLMLLIKPFIC